MSGGVDSSVAAALVAQSGVDAIGVSMQLYDQRAGSPGEGFGSCCTLDDLADARRVAAAIGIPCSDKARATGTKRDLRMPPRLHTALIIVADDREGP